MDGICVLVEGKIIFAVNGVHYFLKLEGIVVSVQEKYSNKYICFKNRKLLSKKLKAHFLLSSI